MARSALILGASGMVGEALAHALLEEGWDVHGAARFSDPDAERALSQAGVHTIPYNVRSSDPAALPAVDVVWLEIWDPSKPELVWDINFYGVGRVVERYSGAAPIVNGCTINVYGAQPGMPSEADPCRPTLEYGHTRVAQENLINYFSVEGEMPAIHVRYAHANTAKRGKLRRMAETIARGESLGPNPDERTQVIALEDFVRVTRLALDKAAVPPSAVNCCHPRVWTMRELAQELHRRLGRGEVVFDREEGGVDDSVTADPARMVDWFGEPTVDMDEVLGRVVEDVKQSG